MNLLMKWRVTYKLLIMKMSSVVVLLFFMISVMIHLQIKEARAFHLCQIKRFFVLQGNSLFLFRKVFCLLIRYLIQIGYTLMSIGIKGTFMFVRKRCGTEILIQCFFHIYTILYMGAFNPCVMKSIQKDQKIETNIEVKG